MIDYRAGVWGFHVAMGWHGSLAPRALTVAIPNAIVTFIVATLLQQYGPEGFSTDDFILESVDPDEAYPSVATYEAAQTVIAAFTLVMIFILYNRSRTSYNRWWEGGTLLQKTRGEWFNAYSSIMAFTSTKPELQEEVAEYSHLVARLFSLLMCCGLQQVSPHRDRPFQIIELKGIEQDSMDFLNSSPDKVEVILQWIQRSMVLQAQSGILPVPPPILSRAFQEVSRGIVNLQNARKIADFPYPYPLAQVSMILQLLHWIMTPFASALALPRAWAALLAFVSIFVLWCVHFNALDLEFPFGTRVNDLPMNEFQEDWNNSLITFLDYRAQRPPSFKYDAEWTPKLDIVMSDASEQYAPSSFAPKLDKGSAVIRTTSTAARPRVSDKCAAAIPKARRKAFSEPTRRNRKTGGEPSESPVAQESRANDVRAAPEQGTPVKPAGLNVSGISDDAHAVGVSQPGLSPACISRWWHRWSTLVPPNRAPSSPTTIPPAGLYGTTSDEITVEFASADERRSRPSWRFLPCSPVLCMRLE